LVKRLTPTNGCRCEPETGIIVLGIALLLN
jgi:hypothetical protein